MLSEKELHSLTTEIEEWQRNNGDTTAKEPSYREVKRDNRSLQAQVKHLMYKSMSENPDKWRREACTGRNGHSWRHLECSYNGCQVTFTILEYGRSDYKLRYECYIHTLEGRMTITPWCFGILGFAIRKLARRLIQNEKASKMIKENAVMEHVVDLVR